MTVRAFVLIKTELGAAADVARQIREVAGVVSASDVTGPYDIIAEAQAGSIDELGRMVVGKVQQIEGITRTMTCPVISL
jgi:DNA-binding Lrp family transcriptional regulator